MTQEFKQVSRDRANNRWIVTLEKDGEDLILPLTDEMLEGTGWKTGDELLWEMLPGRAWIIRKKP
jgi:hypothetical protein